ncbi:MAG: hypothetical protein AAF798_09485 [Bacteroidota bacterium]
MKSKITLLVSLLFSSVLLFAQAEATAVAAEAQSLEDRIEQAFSYSFGMQRNMLAPIAEELRTARETTPTASNAYWLAYTNYLSAIFLSSIELPEEAQTALGEAISILEAQEELDAEAHVILGSAYSYSIGFDRGKAIILSSKANKHYQKALKADPENLRAHLALAKSDYYTPKQYGGGQKVEKHLLKALSLPEKRSEEENAPTWGREEVYYFLVQYYEREDRLDDAKLYAKQGLKQYPEHQGLQRLIAGLDY